MKPSSIVRSLARMVKRALPRRPRIVMTVLCRDEEDIIGYNIPAGNKQRFAPQTNDVFVDRDTGLIYISDRWGLGLHIVEYTG